MSTKDKTYRNPIFNGLRSNERGPDELFHCEHGAFPSTIQTKIARMVKGGEYYRLCALRDEITSAALYLDGVISEMPRPVVASLQFHGFNVSVFPDWLVSYIKTMDAKPLRALTQAQADEQAACVACEITSIVGSRVNWVFLSNRDKHGYAHAGPHELKSLKVGESWLFKDTGKSGAGAVILGAIRLPSSTPEHPDFANQVSRELAATWRRYH